MPGVLLQRLGQPAGQARRKRRRVRQARLRFAHDAADHHQAHPRPAPQGPERRTDPVRQADRQVLLDEEKRLDGPHAAPRPQDEVALRELSGERLL